MADFVFSNIASSTLAVTITDTSTTIQVTDGTDFPAISGGNVCQLTIEDDLGNLEVVQATAKSGNQFTVTRAQEGTTGVAFSTTNNTRVECRLTAAVLENFVQLSYANANWVAEASSNGTRYWRKDGAWEAALHANLSDIATSGHPISAITDLTSTLAAKAPLADPALTGTPTAPTASADDSSTQIATTAFVQTELTDALTTTINQGVHTIWVPAAAMTASDTNGAGSATEALSTNGAAIAAFDFDATTSELVNFAIQMPKSWDEGTITAKFVWTDAATAGTGSVTWGIKAVAISDGGTLDTTFGSGQTVADAFTSTGKLLVSAATSAMTVGGTPAAEDYVLFSVYRNIADTYTQDARLLGVKILYTVDAANDA